MITEKKAANAMGGKTARACDGCLRKRARWYCASDDAFLCQACDASVHSANQLAGRHERLRLEVASAKLNGASNDKSVAAPAWHQGFTRKPRTPRPNKNVLMKQGKEKEKKKVSNFNNDPLVPEIGCEEGSLEENSSEEEQLLYQVPVFDPFASGLYCDTEIATVKEGGGCDLDDLQGFLQSDTDLAEFAADVERLLVSGLNEDCKEETETQANVNFGDSTVKVKDEEEEELDLNSCRFYPAFNITREGTDWNFDCKSPTIVNEEEEKVTPLADTAMANTECKLEMKGNVSLRLNYEAVINAWATQGRPWRTGTRPELNPKDFWPNCMGTCSEDHVHHFYGGAVWCHGRGDAGREARVSRYREKRRTRLFSKKIRYEVRKLNAEKRPRMKGRFVKRTNGASFITAAAAAASVSPYLKK
ncbi:zinc finger protein CONSTANS-LIKE 16-like [Mangifera indica]|uniref:zinc finger protein CONSTANS-LIKE 16-like n=1 Tax=Mangifera indica TaxID=29780 RepID=UPI001CFACE6C|nr:zinc finger protein CONSTANS-LIKE 16-like [Mangifera indica]WED40982.1 CONSTANS-like 16B [Mangifera indica]